MPHILDFSLAPIPESTPTFLSLPRALEETLRSRLPESLARLNGALHLSALLVNTNPDGEESLAKVATYFRCALVEFASVRDLARADSAKWPTLQGFRLVGTPHPAPHMLELLRHMQVHLASSRLSDAKRSLWLRDVPGAKPVDVDVWLVEDLAVEQLRELDAVKKRHEYTEPQLTDLVAWFNAAQAAFGVDDVIYRGVEEVATRLAGAVGYGAA